MPLFLIPGNPLFPDTNKPTQNINCGLEYCHLFQPGDLIRAQLYQTPCGDNEICDSNFDDQTEGADLVTNGSFTGSAAGWTLDPDWSYSANAIHKVAGSTLRYVTQSIAITGGDYYKIQITVSNRTAGSIAMNLGDGSTLGQTSENGTFVFYAYAGIANTDIVVVGRPDFVGTVDNIRVTSITMDCWELSDQWIFADNMACKSGFGTDPLEENVLNYIDPALLYELTFTVSNYISGTLTPFVSTTAGTAVSANGTYTQWFEPSVLGHVKFEPSNDFIGCVSEVTIYALKKDFMVRLASISGCVGDTSHTLTPSYDGRYVTIEADPEALGLEYCCYGLQIIDTCTVQFEEMTINGEFSGGSGITCPDWIKNNIGTQYNFDGGDYTSIYAGLVLEIPGTTLFNTINPNLLSGNYRLEFEIVSNTDTTNIGARVDLQTVGGVNIVSSYGSAPGFYSFNVNGFVAGTNPRVAVVTNFNLAGTGAVFGNIVIDNVSVHRIEPFDVTFNSECLRYGESFRNTKMIVGYSDTNSHGFDFVNTTFKIAQRLRVRAMTPSFPTSRDAYTFSTGTRELNYAELEKYWTLFLEFMTESAHHAMAITINSEHFLIGDDETDGVEYIASDSEYAPQWDRTGASDVAPVSIDIRIKEAGMTFYRRC